MNRRVRLERGDFALGVGAIALAAAYLVAARADAVGAAGVPKDVGWATVAVGALLCLRSVRFEVAQRPAKPVDWRPHLLALGLLGLLVAYVALAPLLGYPLSIALLTGTVAWYAGAPMGWRLCARSLASGAMFWLLFAAVFGLSMPSGALFGR